MKEQKRIQMLREVSLHADKPHFYGKAEALGEKAAEALTDKKRSQISGLENVANSALKTTDIFDFIKVRTARHKEWRQENWGPELLAFLQDDAEEKTGLRKYRIQICDDLGVGRETADGIQVHLLLIREFVRQLAAHYEYACYRAKAGGGS